MIVKLGPHVIQPTGQALAWAGHAPIVKALDDIRPLQQAPDGAIRIFRRYFPSQSLDNPSAVVAAILTALGGYRHPRLYVELFNECYARLGSGLESYVDWTARATAALHQAGLQVAGFSFSTGTPEPDDWRYLQAHGFAGVDALSIHEYWGTQGFSTWNALRYRRVHEWTSGQHPPILITECGRDAVEGGRGGWQRDGVSAEQYVAELVAYDAELQRDDYVLGAAVFTAGPTSDWAAFDTDGITDRLLAQTEVLAAAPAPTPMSKGERAMTYQVGPGIAQKIAEQNDRALSDERWIGDILSVAFGEKGVYLYSKQANRTYFLPAR